MSDYNFEKDEGRFGETRRLDDINKEVKKIEISKKLAGPKPEDDLGDKNAFLDVFESEKVEFHTTEKKENKTDEVFYEEYPPRSIDKEDKRDLKKIVTIAAIIGVLLFMGAFYIFRFGQGGWRGTVAENALPAEETLMLVKAVTDRQELVIFDIDAKKEYTVKTGKDTKFANRKGKPAGIQGIEPGDVVEIVLAKDGQTAEKIGFSSKSFFEENVTGLQVEPSTKSILIKTEKEEQYTYSEDTLFLYDGNTIEPESLAESDVVVLQGLEGQVWSVKVLTYHGYIRINNMHKIKDGILQIDGGEGIPIEGMERIPVTEGAHSLIISGSNIEACKASIFIVPGEDFVFDLSAAQEKTGVLIIKTNVSECKLYINGTETDSSEPVVLNHGDYDVVILKNGYKTWNKKITLNQPSMTITANLEEDIQKGSLTIDSTPRNASVFLDGVEIGISPIQKELSYGNYDLRIKLEGYEVYSSNVTVNKPSDTVTVNLTEVGEES